MSFALTPAIAFTDFVSKVSAATLNYWRASISQAIDGTAGGTYTPIPAIVIGGSGIQITGPLVADDISGHVKTGKTLTVDSGGAFITASGSTVTVGNAATVANGGSLSFASGSSFVTVAGVTTTLGSAVTASGTWSFTSTVGFGATSAVTVASGAIVTYQNGSTLQVNSGATSTFSGNVTVSGVLSGATISTSGAIVSAAGNSSAQNFLANGSLSATGNGSIGGALAVDGYLQLTTAIAAPSTPSTGFRIYIDVADGKLKSKGASGTVTELAVP